MVRVPALRTLENALRRVGFCHVAGVDEVGRGCLAGPVVAGAVILDPDRHIAGVSDSKVVPADEREELYKEITAHAVAWAVASADPREIDHINIHQASLTAMRRAIMKLAPLPDVVLVDAARRMPMAQRGVIHVDRRCAAIADGTIVTHVVRDVRRVFRHIVGGWRVTVRASDRGRWRLELAGVSGRHVWTFAAPTARLSAIVVNSNSSASLSFIAVQAGTQFTESASAPNTANILGDLYLRANQTDNAAELFVHGADVLIAEGFLPKAGAVLHKILKLKPDDESPSVGQQTLPRARRR
jgi:ribonuclease HII